MVMIRRAFAVAVGVVFIAALSSSTLCFAAKKHVHSSNKLGVPARILKGSLVSSGRSFSSSKVPEDTLAGIRLGRPAKEILSKWGNPSRVTVGMSQSQGEAQGGIAGQIPYTPSTGASSGMYGNIAAGVNAAASMLGLQNAPLPGLPGYNSPGMPSPGAAPMASPYGTNQTTGTTGTTSVLTEEEVTWTYDLPGGITLEFIITDGLITQITVGGQGPWKLSKTRTGLQLGDTYKLVLWVCGYPESQKYAGRFLRASYVNKNRALYTFLNNKLVGVTIALVPQELE